MCNINAIISNCSFKRDTQSVCAFIQSVTSVSFIRNEDGDGFFTDNDLSERSLSKINFFDYRNRIKYSKMIVSHQRFTTTGRAFANTQPIETKRYIIVHNGILVSKILTNYQKNYARYTDKSDTYEYADLIEENDGKTNIEKIKNVFDDENGSYSIFLYDKVKDELYYFKNRKTNMYVKLLTGNNKQSMFFTTNKDNMVFLDFLSHKKEKIIKIKDNTIYRIHNKDRLSMVSEGEISDSRITVTKPYHTSGNATATNIPSIDTNEIKEYNYSYEESETNFKANGLSYSGY